MDFPLVTNYAEYPILAGAKSYYGPQFLAKPKIKVGLPLLRSKIILGSWVPPLSKV